MKNRCRFCSCSGHCRFCLCSIMSLMFIYNSYKHSEYWKDCISARFYTPHQVDVFDRLTVMLLCSSLHCATGLALLLSRKCPSVFGHVGLHYTSSRRDHQLIIRDYEALFLFKPSSCLVTVSLMSLVLPNQYRFIAL